MEKQKNTQMFVIAILAVALLTMSVGFAAFSTTLNINGTINVAASSWNVHFVSGSASETGATTGSTKNIGTTTVTFTCNLEKPGDVYTLTVPVKNDGTFDAELTKVTLSSVDSSVADLLTYTLTYDGTDSASINKPVLAAGASKDVVITVTYKDDVTADELPETAKTATLTASLEFNQA